MESSTGAPTDTSRSANGGLKMQIADRPEEVHGRTISPTIRWNTKISRADDRRMSLR
jgi:hypothetical protein